MMDIFCEFGEKYSKPVSIILIPDIIIEGGIDLKLILQKIASLKLPVYLSFDSAAVAIDLVLRHHENKPVIQS